MRGIKNHFLENTSVCSCKVWQTSCECHLFLFSSLALARIVICFWAVSKGKSPHLQCAVSTNSHWTRTLEWVMNGVFCSCFLENRLCGNWNLTCKSRAPAATTNFSCLWSKSSVSITKDSVKASLHRSPCTLSGHQATVKQQTKPSSRMFAVSLLKSR